MSYLKKEVNYEVYFWHADKHRSFRNFHSKKLEKQWAYCVDFDQSYQDHLY